MGILKLLAEDSRMSGTAGWSGTTYLRVKLFIGFGLIIAVLIAVVVSAYSGIYEVQASEKVLFDEVLANVADLPALRANLNAERLDIAMLLESDRSEWSSWLDDLSKRSKKDYEVINRLILRFRNDPYKSFRFGEFIDMRDQYQRERDEQIKMLRDENRKGDVRAEFLGIQETRYKRMRAILNELENLEMSQARQMVNQAEATTQARARTFALFSVIMVVFSVALASFVSGTVSSYFYRAKLEETALARATRSLKMMNACNSVVMLAKEEYQLLQDVCRAIVEVGGHKLAWVGYAQHDEKKSVKPVALAGTDGDYVDHADISWEDTERGRGPTGTVIRTGNPVIVRDTRTEPGFDPWRYRAIEMGFRSSGTFPLKNESEVFGALMVYSGSSEAFDEEEIRLLGEVADLMAFATTALKTRGAESETEKDSKAI